MYTNSSCTLFLFSKDYMPIVIPHCFHSRKDSVAFSESRGMIRNMEGYFMFKGHEDLVFTDGKDFILEGVHSDLVLANAALLDGSTKPGENTLLWSEQDVSNAMKKIKAAKAMTITGAIFLSMGTNRMRHWEITCR